MINFEHTLWLFKFRQDGIFNILQCFLLTIVLWLIMLNVNAQSTWQYTYGIKDFQYGMSVLSTADSGFILAGPTYNTGSLGGDVLIIKTTAMGDTSWTRIFSGAGLDYVFSCQHTSDNGYIISGRTISFGFGGYDVYLIKLDMNGNLQWSKCVGGASSEEGLSCQQTSDSGYVVAGDILNVGTTQKDFYLAKISANGILQWARSYGGLGDAKAQFVQQTFDGGYILGGSANYDPLLIKTDPYGNPIWSKTYGGMYADNISCLKQTADSGFILTGFSNVDNANDMRAILIKTDVLGDTLWTRAYHINITNCFSNYVLEMPNNEYVFTGMYGSPTKILLVKTNFTGDTIWTRQYGGIYDNYAYCVEQTLDYGFIIAGAYENTSPFLNMVDCYLIKTDSLGNSDCLQNNLPVYVSYPNLQVLVPPLSAYVLNHQIMSVTPQVNLGCDVTNLCVPLGGNETIAISQFQISPNPSPGTFKIAFTEEIINGFVELFSLSGQLIYKKIIHQSKETTIQLNRVNDGIYLIRVSNGTAASFQKVRILKE